MNFIGASDLIKKSWSLYWSNFKELIIIAAWLLVPAIAMALLSFIPPAFVYLTAALFVAVFIANIIIGFWVNINLIEVTAKIYLGQKYNTRVISKNSWGKILPLIWVSFLAGLAVFGGMILFIIPGIIIAVWFAFATYINILEGVRGRAALSQSKQLVSGKWWSVFWRFLAAFFVYGAGLLIITYALLTIISMATGQVEALTSTEAAPWWQNIISNLISVGATPLFLAVATILYLELKKFKGIKAIS